MTNSPLEVDAAGGRAASAQALYSDLARTSLGGASGGGEDGFKTRLMEDLLWTDAEADAAMREYRRFLALAAGAEGALSPPPMVDLVWRAHLVETRDYWETWAPLLGRAAHRAVGAPLTAGDAVAGYARALAAYRDAFGPPPEGVWPPVAAIDAPEQQTVRTPLTAALAGNGAAQRWRLLAFGFLSAGLMTVFAGAVRPGAETMAAWIALCVGLIAALAAHKAQKTASGQDPRSAAWLEQRRLRLGARPSSEP